MNLQKIIVALIFTFLSTILLAHEFWLEPQKFVIKVGEKINLRLFVGEDYHGEAVDFSKFKVEKFTHYTANGERNMSGSFTENQLSDFLDFDVEGNHLIAFNNSNKFIELESEKFNKYLIGEGLEHILEIRKQQNQLASKGRELYQRCAKTLLQVGKKHSDTYKKNTGMRLELIPEQNPYETKNTKLGFQVLFDNLPLKNALVLVWHKDRKNRTTHRKYRSDDNGKVIFQFVKKDRYMVSTVQMIAHTDRNQADWESYWGSYTFGF